VDHFLLPRLFGISRPLLRVPSWSEAGRMNVPAVVALLGSVLFGVVGLGSLPSGWGYDSPPEGWGPVPVEAWLLAGLLYVAGVAVTRAVRSDVRAALGYAGFIGRHEASGRAAQDIAAAGTPTTAEDMTAGGAAPGGPTPERVVADRP
jgi:hypothetical protein